MFQRISFLTLSTALLFSLSSTAKVVTVSDAESVAKQFIASKGLPESELVLYNSTKKPAVFRAPEREAESPAYHVFRGKDQNSFIIVSGDDIARPILGYAFDSQSDFSDNVPPAMQDWLDEMENQISLARRAGVVQSAEIARQWGDPGTGSVVKQLNTAKWDQRYPYNLECPIVDNGQCVTGCVATSYAILMKYYGYPSVGNGETPAYYSSKTGVYVTRRDVGHTYDWDSMPLVIENGFNLADAMKIAQLMSDIGCAIQAYYGLGETAANYNRGAIFKHFGYNVGNRKFKSNYTSDEWNALLKDQLDNNRPVLYDGTAQDGSTAHSFIIDGYTDQDYFCVNWGWGGNHDGVFALDALILDFVDFQSNQFAYFDFQPAKDLPVVATVDDTIECPSLDAALGMVPADGTSAQIKLLRNCSIDDATVSYGRNVVIDLNGVTVETENNALCNRGILKITDSKGGGKITVKNGNSEIFSNYGELTVEGGEFTNLVDVKEGENLYYRRCIWSDYGSKTYIKGGKFKSVSGTVCTNGLLKIDGGEFECIGNEAVVSNYSVTDTMTISGGSFSNLTYFSESNNYRRTIWTKKGTVTHFTGGEFICRYPALVANGEVIIDDGKFECKSNSEAIFNNCTTATMTINGGTILNSSGIKEPKDYRRAIWAGENTKTHITGGHFSSDSQVLTFCGESVIDGGTIENNGDKGVGILSAGDVRINDIKIKAYTVVALGSSGNSFSLKCYGGLYSKLVSDSYLGSGCKCVTNTDSKTSVTYRYKVENTSGVDAIIPQTDEDYIHYDLNGMIGTGNTPGIHIIRTPEGKTVKVLYK